MRQSNVSDIDMTIFFLSKKGYGSIDYIETWDTPRFLDVLEYEKIVTSIEQHVYEREREKAQAQWQR